MLPTCSPIWLPQERTCQKKAIIERSNRHHPLPVLFRENAKVVTDVEATTGQVKQAQDVVPPMERLVKGLEQQQAETMK